MKPSDWQALDARIAREVMGWHQNPNAIAYPDWLNEEGKATGYCLFGALPYRMSFPAWQPHKEVAQALMAVRKIVQQGWGFQLRIFIDYREPDALKSAAELWNYDVLPSEGYEETDPKAICLALEEWMDAQKEKQDELAASTGTT